MATISMVVDLDQCVGCFACQNACKMVNDLPVGVQWLKVLPVDTTPEEVHGELYMDRFPVPVTLKTCAGCPDRAAGAAEPLCASVCMGKALFVGSPAAAAAWGEGKRTVVYSA